MRIQTVYVAVFESPEDDEPASDKLCNVICMATSKISQSGEGFGSSEEFTTLFVMDPETGEVANPRLTDVVINSYINEDKEIEFVGSPRRIGEQREDQ